MNLNNYRYLLIILICLFLVGCQYNYHPENSVEINIEVATINSQSEILNNQILDSLSFEEFTNNEKINFNNNGYFVFRITHQEPEDFEHSLLVMPHYLNNVIYIDENFEIKDTYRRNQHKQFRDYSPNIIAFNNVEKISYLLIKTKLSKPVHFSIEKHRELKSYDYKLSMIFTAVYSIILTLVFIHFVFYFFIKRKAYLFYSFYIFGLLFSLLFQEGMIAYFPTLSYSIFGEYTKVIWLKIPSVFYWLFILEFLDLKNRSKLDYKLVWVLLYSELALIAFMLMLSIFKISGVYGYLSQAINLQFIFGILVAIYIPVKYAFKNIRHAQYLAIGVSAHMLTAIMRIKYTITLEPLAFWMPRAFEFGLLFEAMMLSLGLSHKTMRVIKEKDVAESKMEHADRELFCKELEKNFQQKSINSIDKYFGPQNQLEKIINTYFLSALRQLVEVKDVFYVSEDNKQLDSQFITGELINFDFDQYIDNNRELMNSICNSNIPSFQTNEAKEFSELPFVIIPVKEKDHDNLCLFLSFPNYVEINKAIIEDLHVFANTMTLSLLTVKKYQKTVNETRFDDLTQVFNRNTILTKLDILIQKSGALSNSASVAFIDVDNFKYINDKYGHDLGDKCLVFLCDKLNDEFHHKAFVGRFGGDEFIIVFDNYNKTQIQTKLDMLYSYFNTNKIRNIKLEISIGVALDINHNVVKGHDLLKIADKALYKAKEKGKNQYVID